MRKWIRIDWRYTIGEILIVIIGISLAFSMNTWKEQKTLEDQTGQYIESLLDDLEKEEMHLKENVASFRQKTETAGKVLQFMYGRNESPDSALMRFFSLAQLVNYNPPSVTYDIMVNTGDLDLIHPLALQKQLAQHYANQREVEQAYERLQHINTEYFADLLIEQVDYRSVQRGDYSILEQGIVLNLTQSLLGSYQIAIESTEKAASECLALREALASTREKE